MDPSPAGLSDHASEAARPQRSDARRNREAILRAAAAAVAEWGPDAPITDVARRAGVGTATVYRHFPTKRDLLDATFASRLAACVAAVDDAADDPDPWRAFRSAVEGLCVLHVLDRGFTAASLSARREKAMRPAWWRTERTLAALMARAKESGQLREDVTRDDITLLLMATTGITAGTDKAARAAARRLVAYVLQAMRAPAAGGTAEPLPPVPPLGLHLDLAAD
ncbi:TetR/AcrR family transcriptional regulator [Patulibacter sp. S7RM1-6]